MHNEGLLILANEYMQRGKSAFHDKRNSESIGLLRDALHLFKILGMERAYAECQNQLGVVYSSMGNEALAMDCYLEGLEYAKERKMPGIKALFYVNIGSRYQDYKRHDTALEYFKKAQEEMRKEEYSQVSKIELWQFVNGINLGYSYLALGQYTQAKDSFESSERIPVKPEMRPYLFSLLNLKCRYYYKHGEFEKIKCNLKQLMDYAVNLREDPDYLKNLYDLSELLSETGEIEKWDEVIRIAEEFAKDQNEIYFELFATKLRIKYRRRNGQMKEYRDLCVKYTELSERKNVESDELGANSLDLKIALWKKENEIKLAQHLSEIDVLTGMKNRYGMEETFHEMMFTAMQRNETMAIGILDLDSFKMVNDTYGHIQGDQYLKAFAEVLKENIRGIGKAYRYGGDEFIVLIQNAQEGVIERLAEEIKKSLGNMKLPNINSSVREQLTVSQGYYCFTPIQMEKMDHCIKRADQALYYMKKNGRNHYIVIDNKNECVN